jgi:SAM-dependent methyltransferase
MSWDMKLFDAIRQIPDKIGQHYLKKKIGKSWGDHQQNKIGERLYKDYSDYIQHQQAKLKFKTICPVDLEDYDQKYRTALAQRLRQFGGIRGGESVLCLGARLGSEVKAFLDLRCFAVGVDLNPGKANLYVLPGDFHHLQFADASLDIAFSNSVDHVYKIDDFVEEVARVLKPGGLFIIEVGKGKSEGGSSGFYETLKWDSIDDLLSLIGRHGFKCLGREPIVFPFPGEQIFLKLDKKEIRPG